MTAYHIPTGDVLEVESIDGPFDKGVSALHTLSLEISTTQEMARVRRFAGTHHDVCTNGSWMGENYNYFQNGDILIASREHNPILKNPVGATDAHRQGKEFYLTDAVTAELRERANADVTKARESGVLLLTRDKVRDSYPVESLDNEVVPLFLLGDEAKPYAEFLKSCGIKEVPHYVVGADHAQKQDKPFARALWFYDLYNRSVFSGNYNVLSNVSGRVRGVRRRASEASLQKV